MNVLICVNKLNYAMGGVSTHILDLCKNYSKMSSIEHVVVCCDGGEHITKLQELKKIKYIEVPFDKYGMAVSGILKSYRIMRQIIKLEKIDIVHVHSQRILPVTFLLKVLDGVPYLWTNHIDAIPQPRLFKAMCVLMRFPIISVSQELRNMMVAKYRCKADRVYVVNNGTDLECLTPLSDEEKTVLEARYHINRDETPYVISLLSRIFYVKGHQFLLEAIANIPYKNKIKVIIAGHTYPTEVKYRDNLIRFCQENDINAEFQDYSNPRDVFGVSDIFVLPSLHEGFPLVCIEALAMRCAVIRSNTPGWQEIADYVEVVEKKNVKELENAICRVIENDMNRKKTLKGNAMVREYFTKERCADETVKIYKKIICKQMF